jgi:predicted MPP superfamily phosphohydrolase
VPAPPRPNRRRRWAKIGLLVLAIAVGLQIPLVWALGQLTAHPSWVTAFAGGLTAAFVIALVGRRTLWSAPGWARLYLLLWPFFIWWTVALLFALLLPIGLLVSALAGLELATTLWGCLGLAAGGTILALQQRPRLRAREVAIAGLPRAFDGYRVAQISDLHCGPFAGESRVGGWVEAVNRLEADLVAVTGDLIASGTAYVDVVATSLGRLRARDGVYACMGNHDYFTDGDHVAEALEGAGLTLLRNRGVQVRRGDGTIFVAGVDDTWTRRNDLDRTLAERPPGTPVVLLAHDPALFPEAAARGVDLTLSGHTHGGQVGMPFFAHRFNLAKVLTRFTTDLYRLGNATLYVNRGLGTTGPPVRLAVPPEIAVFTLRCA